MPSKNQTLHASITGMQRKLCFVFKPRNDYTLYGITAYNLFLFSPDYRSPMSAVGI